MQNNVDHKRKCIFDLVMRDVKVHDTHGHMISENLNFEYFLRSHAVSCKLSEKKKNILF